MKERTASRRLVWAGVTIVAGTVVVAGMAVFALGPFSPVPQNPPAQFAPEVRIANFSFSPAQLTVSAGTIVTWINADPVGHTVNTGSHGGGHSGILDSGLVNQSQKFTFTFSTPGTFEYHCDPHPSMLGTITVTA